jgi:hypothetical protein
MQELLRYNFHLSGPTVNHVLVENGEAGQQLFTTQ